MPSLVNEQYSVTYSASADAFLFDFATAGIPIYVVRRVGFSYALSNAAPDAVTYYSNFSSDYIQFDGLTVRASNCISPTGATPLDLYDAIQALYTAPGGGVQTITAGSGPIVIGGTSTDITVSHGTVGTVGTTAFPWQISRDAYGHVTGITTMLAPFNQINVVGAGLTVVIGGATPTRSATITHVGAGAAAGTYTDIVSITLNATNHVSGVVTGFPAERTNNKDQPNGYAGLGPFGKIAASQLPAVAITDTFVVGPYADLVTLSAAEKGDIGIVSADPDNTLEGSWILQNDPYSTLSNWVRLIPPTAAGVVYTVNGLQGPNVILGAGAITTGTLDAARLPALSATGDATGTGAVGTGSIPLTLTPTGVGAVSVTNANLTIGVDGRIYAASNGSAATGTMLRAFYAPADTILNPAPAIVIPVTFPFFRTTGSQTFTGAQVRNGLHVRFTCQVDAGTSPSVVLYMEYNGALQPLATLTGSATQGMSIDADIWTSIDDNSTSLALWTSVVRYSVNNLINGVSRLISQGPVHYSTSVASVPATNYTFTPQVLWTTSSGATAGINKGYMTIDRY